MVVRPLARVAVISAGNRREGQFDFGPVQFVCFNDVSTVTNLDMRPHLLHTLEMEPHRPRANLVTSSRRGDYRPALAVQ